MLNFFISLLQIKHLPPGTLFYSNSAIVHMNWHITIAERKHCLEAPELTAILPISPFLKQYGSAKSFCLEQNCLRSGSTQGTNQIRTVLFY